MKMAALAQLTLFLACGPPPQSGPSRSTAASAETDTSSEAADENADAPSSSATDEAEAERFDAADVATRVGNAVRAGDYRAAAAVVEEAKAGPGGSSREGLRVIAYYEATLLAYQHDFAGAAHRIVAYLSNGGDAPDDPTGFFYQNGLIMVRLAEGNPEAALVECYETAELGRAGSWSLPNMDRETAVRLKELWHRAYVLRMLAERAAEPRKSALVAYANRSRRAYRALASTLEGYGDSIAVLDVYFAVLDGDKAAAAAAADRVDYANNGDLEDLYLTYMGFDFAGRSEQAEAVRERIRSSTSVYLAAPIVRRWLERDAANAATTKPAWTPRYPRGTP